MVKRIDEKGVPNIEHSNAKNVDFDCWDGLNGNRSAGYISKQI